MNEVVGLKKRPIYDKLDLDKSLAPKQGLDVKMESTPMEKDEWARKMLRDIGTTISLQETQDGMKYVGSVAIHLLIENTSGLSKPTMRISSITQHAFDANVSEQVLALAFSNAQIQIRRHFNPNLVNSRRDDKR